MASFTEDDVDNLEDFDEAIKLLEAISIDTDDVDDLVQAQLILMKHLDQRKKTAKANSGNALQKKEYEWTSENSTKLVQRLMTENIGSRKKLQGLITELLKLIEKLPDSRKSDLEGFFPNVSDQLEKLRLELETEECVILVAGETGSGKSTLLNLLLGELSSTLLPVSHLSSTSAITELKYCPYGKIVIHSRDPSKGTIDAAINESNAVDVISRYVHQKGDRTKSFEYSHVEVFWPCEWLKGGITIVDSPGVGEDPELTELVKQYLPKAFGFIYVINTPNAGGIDPDRLQDLIFSHLVEQKKEVGKFNPRSALFVCNKWDGVTPSDRSHVKNYVMTQLHKTWPGFSEEQVFFMSAKRAIDQLKENVVSQDYRNLLGGIEKLIPEGLKSRLARQYGVCRQILWRIRVILRSFIFDGATVTEKMNVIVSDARKRLSILEKRPEQLQRKLRMDIDVQIEQAIIKLDKHLKSPEARQKMFTWSTTECKPLKTSSTLEVLQERQIALATKKIKTEINNWDASSKTFEGIYNSIFASFQRDFKQIEREREAIECQFAFKNEGIDGYKFDFESSDDKEEEEEVTFTLNEKLILGFTAPVWVPLGLVVGLFALPVLGIKALIQRIKEKKMLKKMFSQLPEEMKIITEQILDGMVTKEHLNGMFQDRKDHLYKTLNAMLESIPRFIQADRKILEKMECEVVNHAREIEERYKPLCAEVNSVLSKLDLLYCSDIRAYDINISDLGNEKILGEGSFARVYKATWTRHKSSIDVALKCLKYPLSLSNVTDVLQEEDNMSKVKTPNIVKYFGTTSVRGDQEKIYIVYVMELCPNNLEEVIFSDSYNAPGKCESKISNDYQKAVRQAARYAHQISTGLLAMHQIGFLHRDIKPENILIDHKGTVKLADLGLSKHKSDVTGTVCGTPLYMAPEVLKGDMYSQQADIFSFGMLMWELWYGRCVIIEYQVDNLDDFLKAPYPRSNPPNEKWVELMQRCWSIDPKERPSAHFCNKHINTYFLKVR